MMKLLVFAIVALIALPLAYWLLKPKGEIKQFLLITGGALLALTGIVLQAFYPVYLVLLLIVCLSFLSSYAVMKYTGDPAAEPSPVPIAAFRENAAVPEEVKPDVIPEIKSANQQTEPSGMASIEPVRKEQRHE